MFCLKTREPWTIDSGPFSFVPHHPSNFAQTFFGGQRGQDPLCWSLITVSTTRMYGQTGSSFSGLNRVLSIEILFLWVQKIVGPQNASTHTKLNTEQFYRSKLKRIYFFIRCQQKNQSNETFPTALLSSSSMGSKSWISWKNYPPKSQLVRPNGLSQPAVSWSDSYQRQDFFVTNKKTSVLYLTCWISGTFPTFVGDGRSLLDLLDMNRQVKAWTFFPGYTQQVGNGLMKKRMLWNRFVFYGL